MLAVGALILGSGVRPAVAGFKEGLAAYDRRDYTTALHEFLPLARAGNVVAQYHLGEMYAFGRGVPQDYAEAAKWWRPAAEKGDADSQYNLGVLYDRGWGVSPDYAQAATWYRRAAEQGYTLAQFSLGLMYALGQGVPQDYVRAYMWTSLAAATLPPNGAGQSLATETLDSITSKMTPAEIAEAQRLAREWKPKPPKPRQ
jgi:hypothetical protein